MLLIVKVSFLCFKAFPVSQSCFEILISSQTLTSTWTLSHGNCTSHLLHLHSSEIHHFSSSAPHPRLWLLVVLAFTAWLSSFSLSPLGFGNLSVYSKKFQNFHKTIMSNKGLKRSSSMIFRSHFRSSLCSETTKQNILYIQMTGPTQPRANSACIHVDPYPFLQRVQLARKLPLLKPLQGRRNPRHHF